MMKTNHSNRKHAGAGRFLLGVFMGTLTVAATLCWKATKLVFGAMTVESAESPPIIGSRMEAWEAFDAGKIGAAEMSYYDEVYGD